MVDDADPSHVDTLAPWAIKAFSVSAREAIVAAAQKEGLTTGQFVERLFRAWEQDGSPTRVAPDRIAANIGDVAALMQEARAFAEVAGVPVPPAMAREAFALVKQVSRQARGVQPRQRIPKALAAPVQADAPDAPQASPAAAVKPPAGKAKQPRR